MMLQYGITMIVCLAFAYAGMFGYFRLFDDEQLGTDVMAIATAPPRIVTTQGANAQDVQDIVCVPTIHIDNDMEAIPQQTQTCFSSMSKPP